MPTQRRRWPVFENAPKNVHVVASHFDDADQQRETALRGMWTFLATEVMFFAVLLGTYAVYRFAYPERFRAGSQHEELWFGTLNTAVLLTSSFTLALAGAAIEHGRRLLTCALLMA